MNVLVIDIDPQGNASTALGIEHHADVDSIYDVLINDVALADVVAQCPDIKNLICAPATIHLAGAEIELVSLVAREQRLRRAIDLYAKTREKNGEERLDYIFIDCPPSLGLLTVNAFCAARRGPDPHPVRVLRTRGPEPVAQEHRNDPEAPER